MRSIYQKISKGLATGLFAMFVVAAVAVPQSNAATSGGATIHNAVTVTYTSGVSYTATANVDVTVTTLAAAPNITLTSINPLVVNAGQTASHTFKVRSNSNGSDTYTPATPTATVTGIAVPAITVTPTPVTLWGGIVLGSGAGTVNIPAGSETGLVAGTSTIELTVGGVLAQGYTVTTITAGAIASTVNATGVTTAETNTVLTLTPTLPSVAITAGNVALGTQVGEFTTMTVAVVVGTPAVTGVDGSIVTPVFNVTTTALDAGLAAIVAPTPTTLTTTVSSPNLSITKLSRNLTTAGTFAASGTTARPGEIIEYQITVSNAHASAPASSVSISDSIPTYTAIVPGAYGATNDLTITQRILDVVGAATFATTAADTDTATLAAGTLSVNLGTGATGLLGGTINGQGLAVNPDQVIVIYQVTVQ
ncbi:MAG: hypothetical protein R8M46_05425 [Ghiorsea sp.]